MRPLHFSSAPRQSIVKSDVSSGCPQGARGSPAGVSCVSFASSLPLPFFSGLSTSPTFMAVPYISRRLLLSFLCILGRLLSAVGFGSASLLWRRFLRMRRVALASTVAPESVTAVPPSPQGAPFRRAGSAPRHLSVPFPSPRSRDSFRVSSSSHSLVVWLPPSLPPRFPFFLHFRFSFFFHSPCLSHSRSRSRSLFLLS